MTKEKLFSVTIDDLETQTFRSGGKGGQHQNKTDSGVRLIHRPSGAVGESRSDRSQHRNKRLAFERLVKTMEFRLWTNRVVGEITTGKTIDQRVDEQLKNENILVETNENGKWVKKDVTEK